MQDLNNVVGETALRHQLVALHKHKNCATGNQVVDALFGGRFHRLNGGRGLEG
jgi:hypothetical protein